MKIKTFIAIIFISLFKFAKQTESEQETKTLTNNILGFETKSCSGNGGFVLSYRYLLNQKWNLLFLESAFSNVLLSNRNNEVVSIIDSNQYIQYL